MYNETADNLFNRGEFDFALHPAGEKHGEVVKFYLSQFRNKPNDLHPPYEEIFFHL